MKSPHFDPASGRNDPNWTNATKVGITDTPWERLRTYRTVGVKYKFDWLFQGEANDVKQLEKLTLCYFQSKLLRKSAEGIGSKELVSTDFSEIYDYVVQLIDDCGFDIRVIARNYNIAKRGGCPFKHPPQKKRDKLFRKMQSSYFSDIFA